MAIVHDEVLRLHEFDPLADIEPDDVLYQKITADSSNNSGWNVFIQSPASNSLLDNEILIEYNIHVIGFLSSDTNFNPYRALKAQGLNSNWCLRGGAVMQKGMQNLNITVNGSSFSVNPSKWTNAFERLFYSDEESEQLLGMSGGKFDTGMNTSVGYAYAGNQISTDKELNPQTILGQFGQAVFANAFGRTSREDNLDVDDVQPLVLQCRYPHDSVIVNSAYDQRREKLIYLNRIGPTTILKTSKGFQTDSNFYLNDPMTIKIYERIPIFPFRAYNNRDLKMSIPNLRDLNINVTWKNDLLSHISMALSSGVFLADNYMDAPIIHLKWYTTKLPIPRSINLPATVIREYTESFPTGITDVQLGNVQATGPITGPQFLSRNINLEAIPDLLLFYAQVRESHVELPTQVNLEFTNVSINIGGSSGKLQNVSQGELYQMWLNNTRHNGSGKQKFLEWSKFHMVCAIRGRDLGISWGAGFNYPVQIQFQIDWLYNWRWPTLQRGGEFNFLEGFQASKFDFQVVAIYDRATLMLNSDGGSKFEMLKMPLTSIQAQPQNQLQQPTNSMRDVLQL